MPDEPLNTHHPKTEFVVRHKVVRFGECYTGEAQVREEQKLYYFRHQRADLKVSEGMIPVGFLSQFWLDEGHPIYLDTRYGGYDYEKDHYIGPEYQISWRKEKEVLPPLAVSSGSGEVGWSNNLDDLWIAVLSYFERKNVLSEDSLDYLDADPFVLFGIDDQVTQHALKKLQKFPALFCASTIPTSTEWSLYLRIPPEDHSATWLVDALADTELPKPWTCYKGVGSIVCFIRADTGQVTWGHPFYAYFRQLRDFCRKATAEEVMQVRVNRLLWSYEASRNETEHYQEPLVAPEFVDKLAKIFGFDVAQEGCIVRTCKAFLKTFAKTYRKSQDIDLNDVINCSENLQRDSEKHDEMKHQWADDGNKDQDFELRALSNGLVNCVHCETIALAFCLECKDYMCLECYDMLHQRGARRDHAPFRLVACTNCITMPAKLHCTFTDKSLCHKCYAMNHIRMLPPDGKENQPRQINYQQQYIRYASFAKERRDKAFKNNPEDGADQFVDDSYDSVLSTDWHPFYDSRGVKFYHNFKSGERMRQSPQQVPNSADAEAPPERLREEDEHARHQAWLEEKEHPHRVSKPLELKGFNSMDTGERANLEAAADPDNLRAVRAPHRIHMPNEVPAV